MRVLDRLIGLAQQSRRRIVLCEGHDQRVIQAAHRAARDALADIVLVGDPAQAKKMAHQHGTDLSAIELIDPSYSSLSCELRQALLVLRQKRGMTPEQATQALLDPLTFSLLMVRTGHADAAVAGVDHTTAEVVSQATRLIGPRPGGPQISSFFIMLRDEPFHTDTRAMIFADCGIVIDPTEQQLADIAIAAADNTQLLLNEPPRVAMLSFSTNGSARHSRVARVRRATELVRAQRPDIAIDGEVQLDAAIVPEVAARKLPDSAVHGRANVLIFPNLDAANIAYKMAERMGHATAIGPILQGLDKPANDMSRGCSADDIYYMIAVTSVQAQTKNRHPSSDG
ncbi:MAG TPA: phosphate acetyltransferase [Candidimonas sp.]|nr:phosphate acetyltransferase [Candidimonas sp.]